MSLPLGDIVGNVNQHLSETFILLLGFCAFLVPSVFFAKTIMSKDDKEIAQAYRSIETKNNMLSSALSQAKQAEALKANKTATAPLP